MKKVCVLSLLLVLSIPGVASAQTRARNSGANQSWQQFYIAFRNAVRKRDKVALKRMMAVNFNSAAGISYSESDARDAVLRDLDWDSLNQLLSQGVGPIKKENGKAVRQAPPSLESTGMVAFFELGRDGRWRWADYYYHH